MKGTVDKLLNFMKLTEDEEYEEEYEEYEDDEEEEEPEKVGFSFFKKKEKEPVEESEEEVSQPFDHALSREEKKRRFTSTGSKVISMNGRGVEVYVIKPQDFAEAQTAADLLKKGRRRRIIKETTFGTGRQIIQPECLHTYTFFK